jgi:hypothetical protein
MIVLMVSDYRGQKKTIPRNTSFVVVLSFFAGLLWWNLEDDWRQEKISCIQRLVSIATCQCSTIKASTTLTPVREETSGSSQWTAAWKASGQRTDTRKHAPVCLPNFVAGSNLFPTRLLRTSITEASFIPKLQSGPGTLQKTQALTSCQWLGQI